MEGFYKTMKSNYQNMQAQTGIYPEGYLKWLGKRQDNQSNRILYIMFTAQEEQGKV